MLKQHEEAKEHQGMLKDLKTSRTLPIHSASQGMSLNLNDYCLCDLSYAAMQSPVIILPTPSPIFEESVSYPPFNFLHNSVPSMEQLHQIRF